MGLTLEQLREKREAILEIAARYGVNEIKVFGSVLHGEAGADSDVDLLVNYPVGTSLLDAIGFQQDLEELLGCKVDVGEAHLLHQRIRDAVMAEAAVL
mgnify:CR=1 FL=1